MIKITAKASIPLPAKQINLAKWFYSFTETEFQKSSKSNLAMSISADSGKHTFNNKVAISGHLLENHYLEEKASPDHLEMISPHSQLFLFKQIPVPIKVSYELKLVSTSKDSCKLVCISTGQYPKWLEIISQLTFAKYFLQKHQNEETAYFAKDILQKSQNNS